MKQSVLEIIQVLPTLNERELKQVKAACEHLLAKDADAGVVYEPILAVLGIRISMRKFSRMKCYKAYLAGETELTRFIEANFSEIKNTQLHGLVKYLLQLLVDDLRSKGRTPSLPAIAYNMYRIPQIFEHQFPGYKEAGLCGSILTAMSLAK